MTEAEAAPAARTPHPNPLPQGEREFSLARDHRDVMVGLAREHKWRRGVELGLGHGLLFARLIAEGIEMVGVDLGRRPERRARVEAIGGRVLWMATRAAAAQVEDGWADFVFVDAAHSYEAVKGDLRDWRPKVRAGGWFGGHDYHDAHPGVVRAVDEAFPGRVVLAHAIWVAPC